MAKERVLVLSAPNGEIHSVSIIKFRMEDADILDSLIEAAEVKYNQTLHVFDSFERLNGMGAVTKWLKGKNGDCK